MQFGGGLVRGVGNTLDGHHLTGMALEGCLDGGAAHLVGFGDVGAAGQVSGAALQGGKLDAAGLGIQAAGHGVGQEPGGTGEGLMAESVHGVHIVGQFADIAAILQLDAFGHGNDDAGLLRLHTLHLFHKAVHIEGNFRQADHVHALAVFRPGQSCRSGKPAGVAAHDLHDGDILGAVNGGVADDFLHYHADVLGGTAVTGGMVGDHQVVVNGLGHAHKTDLAADMAAVIRQLADGVHAVVAADVEEIADVQFLQDLEQLLVDSFSFRGVPVGQLVAAAAQIAGRGALEQLDVHGAGKLVIQNADPAFQQTGHAVHHAVDFLCPAALAAFKYACQTRVDDRSGTAGLAHNRIFCHIDPPEMSRRHPGRRALFVYLSVAFLHVVDHCWSWQKHFLFCAAHPFRSAEQRFT